MSDMNLEREIVEVVHQMTPEMQQEVLAYLRKLARPKGTPGKLAVQYAREIGFAKEDLAEMESAINELHKQVDDFSEVKFDG